MTTVTIARAAADRQSRARDEGAVAEPLLHDAKPWVQGVRPAVRRVRPTGGMAPTVVRPGRGGGVGGPPRPIPCDRSYEANFHGSRLTRRGKVVVAAIWLVFAVAIGSMVSRPADVPLPAATATVTVKAGDTLWALADQVAPDDDPRVTVEQIIRLNKLESAGDIHPGDILLVPMPTD